MAIVFAFSDNLSAENSNCLRSSATAKTAFLDVCLSLRIKIMFVFIYVSAQNNVLVGLSLGIRRVCLTCCIGISYMHLCPWQYLARN